MVCRFVFIEGCIIKVVNMFYIDFFFMRKKVNFVCICRYEVVINKWDISVV